MPYCLPANLTNTFQQRLKDGTIQPDKLMEMNSQQRREFFQEFLPEQHAVEVNREFESKLLLKNQKQGILTWAKRTAGLKPEIRRDLVARVNRMDEVLNPENQDAFLEDLAAHRLGVTVSMEEAGKISELAQLVEEKSTNRSTDEVSRLEYGRSLVAFHNYVNSLKEEAGKIPVSEQFRSNPVKAGWGLTLETAGSAKSLKATLDNSYIGRQGIKAMWSHPKVWAKHSVDSFKRGVKAFGGQNVMDEVNADIVSRDNYDLYRKARLAVATVEEDFPGRIPEKIPVLKRGFRASEAAFTSQAHLTRADVFDMYLQEAESKGVDIQDEEFLRGLGKVVNSLTGRGDLGRAEPAAQIANNMFFSPRFLKSNVDTLVLHPLGGAGGGEAAGRRFLRRKSARNLGRLVAGTFSVLLTADAIDDDAVDWDPRSANFGKIRVGDTRFDVTGGMGSLITLIARGVTNSSKSSTSGLVSELNSGEYGSRTYFDVVVDFFSNKLSPSAGIIRDFMKGENFHGQPLTPANIATGLFVPIPVENFYEAKNNDNSANILMLMFLDGIGFGSNTYSYDADWNDNPGKELSSFKEYIGNDQQFEDLNKQFNQRYNEWFTALGSNDEYLNLEEEQKRSVLRNKKSEIRDEMYKEYGFKYKRQKSEKLPEF